MTRFDWDGLRPGDRVAVHDPAAVSESRPGVVVFVTVRPRVPNEVGIRVGTGESVVLTWGPMAAIHHDALQPDETCWRCQEAAKAAPTVEVSAS